MSDKLVLYDNIGDSMTAMKVMGETIYKSGMCGCKSRAQGEMMAMGCMAELMNPIQFTAKYHILPIGGAFELTRSAISLHAEFQEHGGKLDVIESTDKRCEIVFSHPKYQPKGYRVVKEYADYEKSGVIKSEKGVKFNWRYNSKRMLQCRAITDGVKFVDPALAVGIPTTEEVEDRQAQEGETTATVIESTPQPQPETVSEEKQLAPPQGRSEDERQAEINKIALQKNLDWFASKDCALISEDLEKFVGSTYEPPVDSVPFTQWQIQDFDALKMWREKLKEMPPQEARDEIVHLCSMQPGSLG